MTDGGGEEELINSAQQGTTSRDSFSLWQVHLPFPSFHWALCTLEATSQRNQLVTVFKVYPSLNLNFANLPLETLKS